MTLLAFINFLDIFQSEINEYESYLESEEVEE